MLQRPLGSVSALHGHLGYDLNDQKCPSYPCVCYGLIMRSVRLLLRMLDDSDEKLEFNLDLMIFEAKKDSFT